LGSPFFTLARQALCSLFVLAGLGQKLLFLKGLKICEFVPQRQFSFLFISFISNAAAAPDCVSRHG
jgi:hypothetical protein